MTAAGPRGLRVHVTAPASPAPAALGCSPAELTWQSGVDVLLLGATKDTALSTDAIVSCDPGLPDELTYRLKRGRSRGLEAALPVRPARRVPHRRALAAPDEHGNEATARLTTGLAELGVTPLHQPAVDMGFFRVDATHPTPHERSRSRTAQGRAGPVPLWRRIRGAA